MKQTIEEQIAEHQREIDRLTAEKEELESLSPERRLAVELHDLQCGWNHTDGCGWYYEVSDTYPGGTWNGYSHKHYLKKAREVMNRLPGKSIDDILEIARAIR